MCIRDSINTSYNEYFSSGIFKISKGKYPMSGDKGAMISDKLASENKLSIGSNVSIPVSYTHLMQPGCHRNYMGKGIQI